MPLGEVHRTMRCRLYAEAANFMISGPNLWVANGVMKICAPYLSRLKTIPEICKVPITWEEAPIFVRQQRIPNDQQLPNGGLIQTLARATSETMNIPLVEDYNTGIGDCTFLKTQFFQREVNGQFVRSSTATGYLNEEIVTQGNEFDADEFGQDCRGLTILAKTTVDKVLLKNIKGKHVAIGAQFVKDGVTQQAYARRGVIVSTVIFLSSFYSAQVLEERPIYLKQGSLP